MYFSLQIIDSLPSENMLLFFEVGCPEFFLIFVGWMG
jgi:hypothetical protein